MRRFILIGLLMATPISAQTLESAAGAQAVAVIGGGGSSGSSVQGLATTPDAIAPSSSTAIGGLSCMVPATSDSVSAVFVSYAGARWEIDPFCEMRALAEGHVAIAYARADILGDATGAARNLDTAERMLLTATDVLMRSQPDWQEVWQP